MKPDVARLVELTTRTKPEAATHWSTRTTAEKLEDIMGLYKSPPEHALVLCYDEKSQVHGLNRTPPGLPLKKAVLPP